MSCPCGSGQTLDVCCGPLHAGSAAPSAEALMRSRYSAFALGDSAYLLHSWHPGTRPRRLSLGATPVWTGLTVVASTGGGPFDATGTVTFEARHDRPAGVLREHSSFARHEGRWVYVGPVAAGA